MNFIFLYGPPGVGKLSVANELSKITGYKVFHNHITITPARILFGFESEGFESKDLDLKGFRKLLYRFRVDAVEVAAESKFKGMIFTSVYGGEVDTQAQINKFIKRVIHILQKHGGKVFPVRLYCTREELYKRIKNSGRKKHKDKIRSAKTLTTLLERYNLFQEIPLMDSLSIDNTKMSPRDAAKLIIKYYEL
jgi:shikimate kinase